MIRIPGLTRRGLLVLLTGAQIRSLLYAGGPDFWNKKEPAEWSPEEINKLITKSPWARQVNVATLALSRPMPAGGGSSDVAGGSYPAGSGMGYPGASGHPMDGGTRRPSSGTGNDLTPSYTATVCWESAEPIQEALKSPLPQSFSAAYVIGVSGLPIAAPDKNLTYLEPKGKAKAQPSEVQKVLIGIAQTPTLLFAFPRGVLSLAANDKEVLFAAKVGDLEIKARFNMKDMVYRNQLAL